MVIVVLSLVTFRLWSWQVWHWNWFWPFWNCCWGCKLFIMWKIHWLHLYFSDVILSSKLRSVLQAFRAAALEFIIFPHFPSLVGLGFRSYSLLLVTFIHLAVRSTGVSVRHLSKCSSYSISFPFFPCHYL